jgi:integrase/recombinase XerC
VPGPVRQGRQGLGAERRTVPTVWDRVPGILEQWIAEARPAMAQAGRSAALWPSERGLRVGGNMLNKRFAAYRDALGLELGLDFHSLRR